MDHWVCQSCALIRRRTRPGSRQIEWIGNPNARRCSNAVGSFSMNSMWTLGRTRPTVEKHPCFFFLEVILQGLVRNYAWHEELNFYNMWYVSLILDLEYESIGRIGFLHQVQSYLPKMPRNRNRVLPRDEIRQAASQAILLSEIQFHGFSLVYCISMAWSGTFIKFYSAARTKMFCFWWRLYMLYSFVFEVSREAILFGALASASV